MEYLVSKPIIIEFNGLPGSGKTTIARQLRRELESLGCKVSSSYYKRRFHRFGSLVFLNPRYWSLIKEIFLFSRLFTKKRGLANILHVANYVRKYNDFVDNSKNGILIIDQGFVQSLVSLAHQDNMPQSDRLDKILRNSGINNMPLCIINCDVDIMVSDNRITSRPKNDCRVEKMNQTERLQTLKVQKENFTTLRNRIEIVCPDIAFAYVDTNIAIRDTVDKIIQYIKDTFRN